MEVESKNNTIIVQIMIEMMMMIRRMRIRKRQIRIMINAAG